MNFDFIQENRQEFAERLVMLARQIYSGHRVDCFLLKDKLIALTCSDITDFEPERLECLEDHSS